MFMGRLDLPLVGGQSRVALFAAREPFSRTNSRNSGQFLLSWTLPGQGIQ